MKQGGLGVLKTKVATLKANTTLQSAFLNTKPEGALVCNQSFHYAKALKANTTLQSVFLDTNPKGTLVCNQSCHNAKTLKANTTLQSDFLSTKPEGPRGRWYANSLSNMPEP